MALALAGSLSAQAPANPGQARKVLVLYSYSRSVGWDVKVADGIAEGLSKLAAGTAPELYEESLDAGRLGDHALDKAAVLGLSAKYASVKLDAVITESQNAALLLLENPWIFPGATRYILHYVPTSSLPAGTGLERRFSAAANLEKALREIALVLPDTRKVVVITDQSVLGHSRSEEIKALEPRLAGLFSIELWNDATLDELVARVAKLERGSAVLYLPVLLDRLGRPVNSVDAAIRVQASSPVPVFSHFDSLLGTGIVGGYMVSARRLGTLIAEIAARGDPALPGSQEAYSRLLMGRYYDAEALKRRGIPDSALPEGSAIVNRDLSFLERYGLLTAILLLIFLGETFLVAALIRLGRQKKRVIAELAEERAGLEGKVAERTAELEAANESLAESASANETLLRELQHRVKNSMTIITGLVGLEAGRAESDAARVALESLGSRIYALSSLYDLLFRHSTLATVGLDEYIGNLAASLADSLGADSRGIRVEVAAEALPLDVKRAVSVGLIVNELVTDAFKHAYPGGGPGLVTVSAGREGDELVLRVEDDGKGLPGDFVAGSGGGLGTVLVEALVADLRGKMLADSPRGARFTLRFPAEAPPARPR